MAKSHLSMRVPPDVLQGIEREARRVGRPPTALAADLLNEALVMRLYPGVGFRDGATGRRPSLLGRRVDVHQVVQSVRAARGSVEEVAADLDVPAGAVRSAMEYYADHRAEIDRRIELDSEQAGEAERRWRASQAAGEA